MSDTDKTDPNWGQKVKDWTAKADPRFDRVLEAAKASQWTPWLIVGVVVLIVVLTVIVTK